MDFLNVQMYLEILSIHILKFTLDIFRMNMICWDIWKCKFEVC